MRKTVSAEEGIAKFNKFWNATEQIKRKDIINVLECGVEKEQAHRFRSLLKCDTEYMSDDYLVKTMRLSAACGNKKNIMLGHFSLGNKDLEKVSDAFHNIQRLTKKYKVISDKEAISRKVEEKCDVAESIAKLDKKILKYFKANSLTFSDTFLAQDMVRNVIDKKNEFEGKTKMISMQINKCRQTVNPKLCYSTVKTAQSFKNTVFSNVDGKMALVAYKNKKDEDKKGLFESKFKYQARMNNKLKSIFTDIQSEVEGKKQKSNEILDAIANRGRLAKCLEMDDSKITKKDMDSIVNKLLEERKVNSELLRSFAIEKMGIKKQIIDEASNAKINHRYAMENKVVLEKDIIVDIPKKTNK